MYYPKTTSFWAPSNLQGTFGPQGLRIPLSSPPISIQLSTSKLWSGISSVSVLRNRIHFSIPENALANQKNVVSERGHRDTQTDTDFEESSSDEEPEDEEATEEEDEEEVLERVIEEVSATKKREKVPITFSLKKICRVCKRAGHEAGFKGAAYIDCPMKPCFLCKMPGHMTMTCPHRIATEHRVIPAAHRNTH